MPNTGIDPPPDDNMQHPSQNTMSMKDKLGAVGLNEFLCKVKTQLNRPHHAQLESVAVEHDLSSFSHCLVDEKERVRCSSTLLFGVCSSHFIIRVKAQLVTLLDGFFFRVDPNSFSEPSALSFSSPLARRENYTPDD